MDFPLDNLSFAIEWYVTRRLRDLLPVRLRERAYYVHRVEQFEKEAKRRMATPVPA